MLLLRHFFSSEARKASRQAKNYFSNKYPDCKVRGVSLRAIEASHYVFAITYVEPEIWLNPMPQRFLSVSRDSDEIKEVRPPIDSKFSEHKS